MNLRNKLAFLLSVLSFIFLLPGVYLSMLTIHTQGAISAPEEHAHIGVQFFDTSNSILKTVDDLFHKDLRFVACMIFLFSVIVPVAKGILIIYALLSKKKVIKKKIMDFVKAIGKWSMCDVFIVATFLAYLSTGARTHGEHHDVSISGYSIAVDVSVKMTAHLEIGFYCFLTYCLLSLIALQLYKEN